MSQSFDQNLRRTPLHDLHVALGARLVPFAGYAMPVQYPTGILAEHRHARARAGLFDVSHMGQVTLRGATAASALERLVPADIAGLARQAIRYTMLTDQQGGILDDLMVGNGDDHLALVVNAGNKEADVAHLRAHLGAGVTVETHFERALLALQGPAAATVMGRLGPEATPLGFMTFARCAVAGFDCVVARSGYTGEDGFEIAVDPAHAADLARRLLADPDVAPVGLGARDSLRLEAGLCLHGHDIDTTTTPIEAGLAWTIGKRRREQGGFPGADRILREIASGPARRRVGLRPDGGAPAREGTEILDAEGRVIGRVTSGGFGATVNAPIAMGYVATRAATPGTAVQLVVRGAARPSRIVPLPFVPHRYARS
ncbi:MAG: glycine cleavage system aminomethyltransferase GcvT [Alphaproteobacteria bacterium]|nr:glycine cleavage system aminomethyltransferase GcvT [Alphaproteobacteria bacterium]